MTTTEGAGQGYRVGYHFAAEEIVTTVNVEGAPDFVHADYSKPIRPDRVKITYWVKPDDIQTRVEIEGNQVKKDGTAGQVRATYHAGNRAASMYFPAWPVWVREIVDACRPEIPSSAKSWTSGAAESPTI